MAVRAPLPDRAALSSATRICRTIAELRRSAGIRGAGAGTGAVGARPPAPRDRAADLPPAQGESAPWIIRTALCAEVRDGVLRVFMPPQQYLEDYLELVAAVEDTAADSGAAGADRRLHAAARSARCTRSK